MSSPMPIDDLSDDAALRVVVAHPALDATQADALRDAVGKLLAQFLREGPQRRAAVAVDADGAFLLIAHEPADATLSGCRNDMIAGVLALHERRSGHALLAPPPIVLDEGGRPRCVTQRELRARLDDGSVDEDTCAWDHLCTRLGDWRGAARRPAREIPWLAAAMRRLARRGA